LNKIYKIKNTLYVIKLALLLAHFAQFYTDIV